MGRCQIAIRYAQSSGEPGEFKTLVSINDFSETIPALLKYVSENKGKVIQCVISGTCC